MLYLMRGECQILTFPQLNFVVEILVYATIIKYSSADLHRLIID